MQFTWPLSENAVATLTVSKQLDPDDVELLSDYFAVAKRALVKAARTQQAAASAAAKAAPVEATPEVSDT
jgi:DNA-binding protein YbaB